MMRSAWIFAFLFASNYFVQDNFCNVIVAPDKRVEFEEIKFTSAVKKAELEQEKRYTKDTIDVNKYIISDPVGYSIGILLDPCRELQANCCVDKFGDPMYIDPNAEPMSYIQLLDEFGNIVDPSASRLADRPTIFDANCYVDAEQKPYRLITSKKRYDSDIEYKKQYENSGCIGRLQALAPMEDIVRPPCWDHNDSVNALETCAFVDGRKKSHCVSVAYTQNAYIVQCNGEFALDNHCGTFLELHEPGNEEILSQTRLLGEYTSGFRTTSLPLYYAGDHRRTICIGDYEIWWVQRTKYNFIIQKRKKFRVISPQCEFDSATNMYKKFHELKHV